jgi:hypothetical protein
MYIFILRADPTLRQVDVVPVPVANGQYILGFKTIPTPAEGQTGNDHIHRIQYPVARGLGGVCSYSLWLVSDHFPIPVLN